MATTTTKELRGGAVSPEASFDRNGESPFNVAMLHLRYAGLPFDQQRRALEAILRADPLLSDALQRARDLALPDWMIVSGAIYNTVWNHLTAQPPGYGVKDIDLLYFEAGNLSYEAEDRVIGRARTHFAGGRVPVEPRNQARVHLWYPERFGHEYPRLRDSADALRFFASKSHAVGVSLADDDRMTVTAPFGLDLIFSFRVVANHALPNRATHEAKGARARSLWPEVTVEDWDAVDH